MNPTPLTVGLTGRPLRVLRQTHAMEILAAILLIVTMSILERRPEP
jgi:hypothetical protein